MSADLKRKEVGRGYPQEPPQMESIFPFIAQSWRLSTLGGRMVRTWVLNQKDPLSDLDFATCNWVRNSGKVIQVSHL